MSEFPPSDELTSGQANSVHTNAIQGGDLLMWTIYDSPSDHPGKFIVHAPQIRGDYPTREGLGRQLAYWFALKLIATRGAPQRANRRRRTMMALLPLEFCLCKVNVMKDGRYPHLKAYRKILNRN